MFTGNKSIDRFIIGLNIFAFLATLGIFVYKDFIYQRPYPDDYEEYKKLQAEMKSRVGEKTYKINKLTINLIPDGQRLRYLDLETYLVPFKEKDLKTFEEFLPMIIDGILDIAGSSDPDELNTVTGKLIFESQIKNHINKAVGKVAVKKVYFSKFVIN